jgi:hypothetical protein
LRECPSLIILPDWVESIVTVGDGMGIFDGKWVLPFVTALVASLSAQARAQSPVGGSFPSASARKAVVAAGMQQEQGNPGETYFFCEPPRCKDDRSVTFSTDALTITDPAVARRYGQHLVTRATDSGKVTHFRTKSGDTGFTIHGTTRLTDGNGKPRDVKHYSTITFIFRPDRRLTVTALSQDVRTSLRLGSRGMIE